MIKHADEKDLQRKIARKLSEGEFSFQVSPSSYFCDVFDSYHGIYIEVKLDRFGPSQLIYGSVREFGNGVQDNFIPQIFGLANANSVMFYKVPPYSLLKTFFNSIDPTGRTAPSQIKNVDRDKRALEILGEPFCINDYSSPLDFDVPYIFITPKNIFYIMSRLERYEINIAELISKIADVHINRGQLTVLKKGGITDNVDGSIVQSKKIKFDDVSFVQALRITPQDVKDLSEHLDTYKEIGQRRSLGKFYTKPHIADKVHDIITKYVDPDFIIDPYAGTGSLMSPFRDCKGLMNDISPHEIEVAKLMFEGTDFAFDSIDCIAEYSAEELVEKWKLREIPHSTKVLIEHLNIIDKGDHIPLELPRNFLIYSNPPFGSSTVNKLADSSVERGKSRKIKITYRDELIKYGRGDLLLPAIGQMIELSRYLGGYLAFFSPLGVLLGRVRHNKLLKQLLSNFTFLEGHIFSGKEFNGVDREKPIAFTIWKFGGSTKHLNLKFDCYGQEIKLGRGLLIKEGWRYSDAPKAKDGDFMVAHRECFNVPQPAMFHCRPKGGGSRVIPQNVKIDIGFEI